MTAWAMATGGAMTVHGQAMLTAALAARVMAKNWDQDRAEWIAAEAKERVIRSAVRVDDPVGLATAILAAEYAYAHRPTTAPAERPGTPLWGGDDAGQ